MLEDGACHRHNHAACCDRLGKTVQALALIASNPYPSADLQPSIVSLQPAKSFKPVAIRTKGNQQIALSRTCSALQMSGWIFRMIARHFQIGKSGVQMTQAMIHLTGRTSKYGQSMLGLNQIRV